MSKEDKHMGIPKPKYDPKLQKPAVVRPSRKKPFLLVVPEREPTEEELIKAEEERKTHTFFPEWMLPWKESRINKYATRRAAEEALAVYRKRGKDERSTYWFWFSKKELERAVIIDTRSKT